MFRAKVDAAKLEPLIEVALIGTSMDGMDAESRMAIAAVVLDNLTEITGLRRARPIPAMPGIDRLLLAA